jgi:hypothetical protein
MKKILLNRDRGRHAATLTTATRVSLPAIKPGRSRLSFKAPVALSALPAIAAAALFLFGMNGPASAAGPATDGIPWSLRAEDAGKLPQGWKVLQGEWVVRNEDSAEVFKPSTGIDWNGVTADQLGRVPVLVMSDDKSGVIEAGERNVADFDLVFRTKQYMEKGYWNNQFRFRIQPDQKRYYSLWRERPGQISLAADGPKDADRVIIQTSARPFSQREGDWLWMRVTARGNHFQVRISSDGISWIQAIDADDPKSTYASGMLGFSVQQTTRIVLGGEAMAQDETRRKAGAWLETVAQARAFRADDLSRTFYKLKAEVYVLDAERPPSALEVTGGAAPAKVPLSKLHAGLNRVEAWVPVPADSKTPQLEVALLRGGERIDTATFRVTNVLGLARLQPGNPEPAKAAMGPQAVTRQTYIDALDRIYARYGNSGRFDWDARWADNAILFRATGETTYLDRTLEWVRRWLADRATGRAPFPHQHFASRYGFAVACAVALESGKLTETEQKNLRALISDFLAHERVESGGVINRSTGYALAYPLLLKLVPDYPLRKEVESYIDRFKEDLMAHPEGLENSTNYMPITLMYLVRWIDDYNPELWRDARVKEVFGNLLQLMTPSGDVPMYGDYGGGQRHGFMLVSVFERLAAVYKDGRFKWAAQTMARRCLGSFDVEKVNGWDSQALACVISSTDDSIAPVAPESQPALLKRLDGHLDKLVLRSGWGADDHYALIDLLNGCEHGDNGALSVVSISRGARQSLMDKAGRDIGFHSLPLVRDRAEDIPYRDRPFDFGEWHYACFDLPLHWSFGNFSGGIGSPMMPQYAYGAEMLPYEFTYDPGREFAFCMSVNGSGHATVTLDDIKLIKRGATPAQPAAEMVLEDFEGAPKQWVGEGGRVEGGHSGKYAGRFEVNFDNGGWIGRKFPVKLDINAHEWDQIEFWFKLESDDERMVPGTLSIGDHLPYPHNYLWHHSPSFPVTLTSMTDTPLATFASLRLDERDSHGNPQTKDRQLVFLKKSAVMWVRDTINRQGGGPWTAAQVWQLGQLAPARGANWTDSWVDDNLLVWCLPREGRVQTLALHPYTSPYGHGVQPDWPLSFHQASQGEGPIRNVIFDAVLVPHDGSADPRTIAEGIKVVEDSERATVIDVGGDLLLANRTGGEVSAGGVTTDCKLAYIQRERGAVMNAAGDGGTRIVVGGRTFPVEGEIPAKPAKKEPR